MRPMLTTAALLLASTVSAAEPPPATPDAVPAALASQVARGDEALREFRERLFARLNALLLEGGPVRAIQGCRAEAPALAKEIGAAHQVRIGRTSHKLRNAANAPPAWARSHVEGAAGKKPADVKPAVVDLGDRVGLLRPIVVMPACTRCHGPVEGIDADVRAELARVYPSDAATRFAAGDLRGFMWAEVPKR
jgi:hypothetical protein